MSRLRLALALLASTVLAGCGSAPPVIDRQEGARPPAASPASRSGGYYKDDGPGNDPPDLDAIADAEPRVEPLHRFANNPYTVFGVGYTPLRSHAPFRQRGLASWYGRMFHGQKTSSGEIYDMYGMTAAHPTLPIPSYVRVTHARSGKSVIVRVNDRGPFHPGRIIDLSYAAAHRLGYVRQGSAPVEVELLTPDAIARLNAGRYRVAAAEPAPQGAVYVQVGAFSSRANAEGLRAKIVREVAELTEAAVEVLQRDGAFRVHVGPFRGSQEATGLAQRLREALQLSPFIVTR